MTPLSDTLMASGVFTYPPSIHGVITYRRRAKKARQKERYAARKCGLIEGGWEHFEIYAVYPPKQRSQVCRTRRIGRQLATSAGMAAERAHQSFKLALAKGAELFVVERFHPNKQVAVKRQAQQLEPIVRVRTLS